MIAMKKFRILAIGLIALIALSGTALMANSEMRQVVFGISVNLDGVTVQFEEDARPFVIDGRTFLPVRTIADLAGLGVDFDSATNTVLLTSGEAEEPTSAPMISEATTARIEEAREVVFGISVSLDGTMVQFTEDMRPFVIGGRTFLPVRAIADLAGLDVDFDGETNTVLLTSGDAPQVADSLAPAGEQAVPPTSEPAAQGRLLVLEGLLVETSLNLMTRNVSNLLDGREGYEATIGGRTFPNSIVFAISSGMTGGEGNHIDFALNGEYILLTGYVGVLDNNHANRTADIRIFGDGELLAAFEFTGASGVQPMSIDVTGVQELIIRGRNTDGAFLRPIVASPRIQ